MSLTSTINIDNFDNVLAIFKSSTIKDSIKTLFLGTYAPIKTTIKMLTILADLKNEEEGATLESFKQASEILIEVLVQPLLVDCKKHKDLVSNIKEEEKLEENAENEKQASFLNTQPEVLAKWWVNYLSILQETYNQKKDCDGWKNHPLENWFPITERNFLTESIKGLEQHNHWMKLLYRGCCAKKELLSVLVSPDFLNYEKYMKEYREYVLSSAKKEVDAIKKSNKKDEKIFKYRRNLLEEIINIIEKDELEFASLLSGYLGRKKYPNLKHSVIIGDDGGLYALVNTIDNDEIEILLQTGEIQADYLKGISKESADPNKQKIIIGKGTFGTIRIALALTINETSQILKPGQIICVKKTGFLNKRIQKANEDERIIGFKDIYENAWNDYLSGEVGNLIFSPDVYDMKIIDSIKGIEQEHQKGYTLQKFIPVYDGSRVFGEKGKYNNNWIHQKSYLIHIFKVTITLLKTGICMTDMKPENTLYDGDNYRGMLIDLAGVVRKSDPTKLEAILLKDISEFTTAYTAPEILNNIKNEPEVDEEEDDGDYEDEEAEEAITVNLWKCMSFSMGQMIRDIILKFPNQLPFKKVLEDLSNKLKMSDPDNRMPVEKGLALLENIGNDSSEQKVDFSNFIKVLLKETFNDLPKFGLNPNMLKIETTFIELMVGQLDPLKYPDIEVDNLKELLEVFIYDLKPEPNQKERVFTNEKTFVLLGSSGSGKSTVLQLQYYNMLKKWTQGDPIPLYINLSIEDDLRTRWNWVCEQIGENELKFNIFSGYLKYPMVVFVDSFDEVPTKINYVTKFFEDLGNNVNNKIIICCRSEFIQKDSDFVKYFKPQHSEMGFFTKRFIAQLSDKNFDYQEYIKRYYVVFPKIFEDDDLKMDDIFVKIQEKNLNNLMKTGYMVHLTLEVLPEIIKTTDTEVITRRKIYQKYTRKKIDKVDAGIKNLFKEKFMPESTEEEFNKQFIRLNEKIAMLLARILHILGLVKMDNKKGKAFFKKYFFNPEVKCFENHVLAGIFRALDLTVEIRGYHHWICSGHYQELLYHFNYDGRSWLSKG